MDNFEQRTTTLDLNGPTLSWLTEPTGVTTCGIATYIGIATATFPVGLAASYATNTGSLTYQWWYEKSLSATGEQGKITNGSMSGLGLTGITGAATTTLTVYGTSTTFQLNGTPTTIEGLKFFLRPDYTPSAYGTADPITAGTGRSTGNAINENITDANTYTVDSNKANLILNPTIQITTQPSTQVVPATQTQSQVVEATFDIVGIVTGPGVPAQNLLSYQWTLNGQNASNGSSNFNVTVPVAPTNVDAPGWNGAGIYYESLSWQGKDTMYFSADEESGITHSIRIEGLRDFPENGNWNVEVEGGKIYKCYPLSSPANLHIGGNTPAGGGNTRLVIEEGGDDWNDMILNTSGGGTFVYYSSAPQVSTGTQYQSVTLTDTISGSTTNQLKVSTGTAGIQTVSCRITHPTACNSPLYSDVVNLNVLTARNVINQETFSPTGAFMNNNNFNLNDGAVRFDYNTSNDDGLLCIYPPEKDVLAKITMAGSAGFDSAAGSGGEGGVTTFWLTMKQNVEYIVILGGAQSPSANSGGGQGSFLYEKANLLAVCGGGGAASYTGGSDGGDGGGIGVRGSSGVGSRGGLGGEDIPAGQLPLQGFYPGGTFAPIITPRQKGRGRVSACTFGQYWISQGYTPCQDLGVIKMVDLGGNTQHSSASIARGFKPGLGHRDNSGTSDFSGTGGGGSGAYGGHAGFGQNDAGGGGSGYTNGEVEVITTQQGGNTSVKGYIIFELS
tara:strand:+ start:35 stop:2218 length:2184 start_codon:yes stop_codon:yes gene_type:complete